MVLASFVFDAKLMVKIKLRVEGLFYAMDTFLAFPYLLDHLIGKVSLSSNFDFFSFFVVYVKRGSGFFFFSFYIV